MYTADANVGTDVGVRVVGVIAMVGFRVGNLVGNGVGFATGASVGAADAKYTLVTLMVNAGAYMLGYRPAD